MKKILKWGGIALLALIFISAVSNGGNNKSPSQSTVKQEVKQVEEKKDLEPIILTDVGQKATQAFALESGLSIFKMKHTGKSNFIITLIDENGDRVESLVNEIGVFDGSIALGIEKSGKYILDVSADGNWTVEINQPRSNNAVLTTSFSGVSKRATERFQATKGLKTVEMKHSGKSNFIITLLDGDGNRIESLVNEIGDFDGSKAIKVPENGIYIFDVDADGEWSINF